ncbi:hypothetical protein HDU97_007473 [Phlyctochytrium planicorne]|nr:hypothetical protein HDU97_007473 [Phlyctochytrium planicorne]
MAAADYIPVAVNSRIETEDVLGPLPEGWEKAEVKVHGRSRYFFVDNRAKRTTWIDPRTAMLRKHNINDVVVGELPYGWEELFDEDFGIFYTDHTTETNYAGPPWDEEVKHQVNALKSKLGAQLKRGETHARFKQETDQQRIRSTEQAIADLLAQRKKLDDISRRPTEIRIDTNEDDIDRKISQLRRLNDQLDAENRPSVSEAQTSQKSTTSQVTELRTLIEAEKAQRNALESYVMQLKEELLSPDQARLARITDERSARQAAIEESKLVPLERETDVTRLRARLEFEKQQRQHLRNITDQLFREKEAIAAGEKKAASAWVKDLDIFGH